MGLLSFFLSPEINFDGLNSEEIFELGYKYKREYNFDKSISCYKKALEYKPFEFGIHNALGKVCYLNNDFSQSLSSYLKACHIGMMNYAYDVQNNPSDIMEFEDIARGYSFKDDPRRYLLDAFFSSAYHIGHSYIDDPSTSMSTRDVFVPPEYRNQVILYRVGLSGKDDVEDERTEVRDKYSEAGRSVMDTLINWDNFFVDSEEDLVVLLKNYDSVKK